MASTADLNRKREAIRSAYNGLKWSKKVDLMDPDQVLAVYLRLQLQKKL